MKKFACLAMMLVVVMAAEAQNAGIVTQGQVGNNTIVTQGQRGGSNTIMTMENSPGAIQAGGSITVGRGIASNGQSMLLYGGVAGTRVLISCSNIVEGKKQECQYDSDTVLMRPLPKK